MPGGVRGPEPESGGTRPVTLGPSIPGGSAATPSHVDRTQTARCGQGPAYLLPCESRPMALAVDPQLRTLRAVASPPMARITILQNSSDAINVSAGTVLFRRGDQAQEMYVVLDGEIEVSAEGTQLGTARRGESLGEMALIDNVSRSATAVAKTDARVVPIDRRRFMFMVAETPNFALQLLSIMAERLRADNDRLVA